MTKYRLFQVDVFTQTVFQGNAAGVILDAKDLIPSQMQAIARELNNSETAFILPPEDESHDVCIRFFTPTMEVPTCGHATVAAHYVRALINNLPSGRIYHKIGIGTLPIDIVREGKNLKVFMTQGKPVIDKPLEPEQVRYLLQALNLNPDQLEPRCPIQKISTGNSKYIIGVRDQSTLDGMHPNMLAIKKFADDYPCTGLFTFCFASDSHNYLTRARMFAPQIGIDEDPVTGNGNGPLGCYLVINNLVEHDGREFEFSSIQGEAMGRPGIVEVAVDIEEGLPIGVRVGGAAVIAFETNLTVI